MKLILLILSLFIFSTDIINLKETVKQTPVDSTERSSFRNKNQLSLTCSVLWTKVNQKMKKVG